MTYLIIGWAIGILIVILLMVRRYKKHIHILETLQYRNSFSSKQPREYFFLYLLHPILGVGLIILLFQQVHRTDWFSWIFFIALLIGCLLISIYGVFEMATFFKKAIDVNGKTIAIESAFGKTYEISPEQLTNFHIGMFQRHQLDSILMEFVDEKGKKHRFSMHLYYEPYLLLNEWVRRHTLISFT